MVMLAAIVATLVQSFVPGAAALPVQQGKPTSSEPIHVSFKAPPPTLGAMILHAQLVATGRVVGLTPRDSDDPRLGKPTRTGYQLRLDEIIRAGPASAPAERVIEVVRRGGVRDRGTYIERSYEVGFPAFEHGRTYLMFLVWNAALDAWVPAYGPDSAIDLTNGVAHSAGKSETVRALEGKPTAEVLAVLRNATR